MIEIRQLLNNKKDEALLFAKKVYIESKDESYSEQGIETLKGLIAADSQKRHICLFFVDKVSQGKGIGNELMRVVVNDNENSYITVNSSRYGVPIYEKLGFVKMEEEKERDGLRFTPMKLILKNEVEK